MLKLLNALDEWLSPPHTFQSLLPVVMIQLSSSVMHRKKPRTRASNEDYETAQADRDLGRSANSDSKRH